MRTTPEEYSRQDEQQYKAHLAKKIRAEWGSSVPADADDDEVLSVWTDLNAPTDATQEDVDDVLREAYGQDYVSPKQVDRRNVLEKAQDVGAAVAPALGGLAANVGAAMSAAVPAMAKVAKVAGKSAPAQLGMAGYYGTQLAGEQIAGSSLEKTANEMPVPNIADLRRRGYTEQQIRNLVKGYTDTQQSLMQDIGEMGQRGVGTAAEAIANSAVLPMGLGAAEHVAAGIASKAAAKAGAKAGLSHLAGKTAARGLGGAAIGGAFGGVDSVVHRSVEAAQAGEGADTILGHMTKGLLGPGISNALGASVGQPAEAASAFGKGFGEAWKFGALLGSGFGLIEGGAQVGKTMSAARKAKAAEFTNNARLVAVQKFAEKFDTSDVLDRFKTDVQDGVAQGQNSVQIATNIVSKLHPEVAASEPGMKAIAEVAVKLEPAVVAYQKTANMNRPLLPTRQGIGSDESVEAGQQFADYLGEGDFRPDTHLSGPRPEGFEPNNHMRPAFPGLPPAREQLTGVQPEVPGFVEDPHLPANVQMQNAPNYEQFQMSQGQAKPVYGEPVADQRLGTGVPTTVPPTPSMQPQVGGPSGEVPTPGMAPEPAAFPNPEQVAPRYELPPGTELPGTPASVPKLQTEPRYSAPIKIEPQVPSEAPSAVTKDLGSFPGISVTQHPDHVSIDNVTTHNDVPSGTALKAAIASSDRNSMPLKVELAPQAGPKGGMIPVEKQAAWYKQHGFRELPGAGDKTVMWRDPIGEHQARVASTLDKVAEAAQKRINSRVGRLNAGFDPADIKDHSLILAANMFSKRLRNKAAIETWAVEKWGESVKPHLEKLVTMAQKHFTRMFKTSATAEKNLKTLLALGESGSYGANWYEKTADWAKQNFGEDADMMLRFLAVTSANGQTESGAAMALKAFAQWKAGMPFEGFRGDSMVGQLKRIVDGESLGEHTKIQQFYNALKGDPDAIVLDRWMMDALNLKDKGGNLRENDYRIYAQVVDDLAEMNNMTPRQFQAAVWEGARVRKAHISEKTGGRALTTKSGSARPLEELVDRKLGGMTIDQYIEAHHGNLKQMERLYQGLAPVRKGEKTGHTFNLKTFAPDTKGGYVTSLISTVIDKKKLYPGEVLKFAKQMEPIVKANPDKHFTVGVFQMPDETFSLDFNVTLQDRAEAIKVAKTGRQLAVGHLAEGGEYLGDVKTGYNPKKHGPQFLVPKDPAKRIPWVRSQVGRVNSLLHQSQLF